MSSLFCAITIRCCQAVFDVDSEKPLGILTPVNVRGFCNPPVEFDQMGPFFSSKSMSIKPEKKTVWEQSKNISTQLRSNIKEGKKYFQTEINFPESLKAISNLPIYINLLKKYSNVFIGDKYMNSTEEICISSAGNFSLEEGDFKLEAMYAFQNLRGYGGLYAYPLVVSCGSVNDELYCSLNFIYPRFSLENIEQFTKVFRNTFFTIAQQSNL
jgi:hypothetical protein